MKFELFPLEMTSGSWKAIAPRKISGGLLEQMEIDTVGNEIHFRSFRRMHDFYIGQKNFFRPIEVVSNHKDGYFGSRDKKVQGTQLPYTRYTLGDFVCVSRNVRARF